MADLPFLKANEKLPRGAYFYVQVGHCFYAGEEAETQDVEVKKDSALSYYDRRGNRFGPIRDYARGYGYGPGRTGTKSRVRKDQRLEQAATYLTYPKSKKVEIKKEFTGKLHPKLVGEAQQAKRYRRKDLVEKACERLKTMYADSGAQVSVRYEGGQNEHP